MPDVERTLSGATHFINGERTAEPVPEEYNPDTDMLLGSFYRLVYSTRFMSINSRERADRFLEEDEIGTLVAAYKIIKNVQDPYHHNIKRLLDALGIEVAN